MIAKRYIWLSVVLAVGLLLTGCSSRALHEAQEVVKQADSLRAEGVAYTDSVTMAGAYNTLGKWQYLYPTDYARACYYYGRLLRNNDDPVAAMQVFINGTHSHTRDYHILGRTYSNMGSICHLANEFQLSYDMYSRSADMFLKNGDTILYYFLLNDMAFECAMQGKKEETLFLIDSIEKKSTHQGVLLKLIETKAEMYMCANLYDSAIYYSKLLYDSGNHDALGLLIQSQAYSYLGEKDSAVYFAKQVIAQTKSIYDLGNAYYMLTNDNTLGDVEEIKEMASTRADILLEVSNQQSKLSQASQLLEQDLTRKPDWRWIYVLIGIILMIGSSLGLSYAYRRYRIIKKNNENMRATIEQKCDALNSLSDKQLQDTIYWKDFNSLCHFMNGHMNGVISKLLQVNSHLTEQNIRLCIVTIIGCSYNRSAAMLRLSKTSISKSKQIVANKLGTDIKSLRSCLLEISYKN